MLIKCEVPEAMSGIVSSAGPIDCAPTGLRGVRGGWKGSLGSVAMLGIVMFLLVVVADEAMGGKALEALLHTLGRG